MNVVMAFSTGDEGLSTACSHDLDPLGLFLSAFPLKIFQGSNMMHFDSFV
jgi:hypothetical protein